MELEDIPYIIKEQAFGGRACVCHGHFWGRSLCLCQHRLLPQNGTCPNMSITTRCRRRDDAIFDDVTTSITTRCLAVMTKSSSKVLGRFLTINSFTGRSCYRKAKSKTVQLNARPKFPGFKRGSGYSYIHNFVNLIKKDFFSKHNFFL
jgi:hypothetical protein